MSSKEIMVKSAIEILASPLNFLLTIPTISTVSKSEDIISILLHIRDSSMMFTSIWIVGPFCPNINIQYFGAFNYPKRHILEKCFRLWLYLNQVMPDMLDLMLQTI